MDLTGTAPGNWLSAKATCAAHGWVGTPVDPELTKSAAAELGAFLNRPLPRSFSEAGGADMPLHVEAALRIELGLELDQGYVVQSKPDEGCAGRLVYIAYWFRPPCHSAPSV